MALGLIQPVTEMSTRNISWGVMAAGVLKFGNLNLLEPSGPVQACNGIALPLPDRVLRDTFVEVFRIFGKFYLSHLRGRSNTSPEPIGSSETAVNM